MDGTKSVECYCTKCLNELSELNSVPSVSNSIVDNILKAKVSSEVSVNNIVPSIPLSVSHGLPASGGASDSDEDILGDYRRNSSTQADFLDIPGNFLSCTPVMSESEIESDSAPIRKASNSKGLDPKSADNDVASAVLVALERVNELTEKLISFEEVMVSTNNRLESIEALINTSEPDKSGSVPKVPIKSKSKLDRVEFERDRQLKVMLEELLNKNKNKCKSIAVDSEDEPADEVCNLKSMKSKMSSMKKEEAKLRLASRLRQAGNNFPAEADSSASSESGNESDAKSVSCKTKSKVKSGARIRLRPVVKTELWPHTIANEQDGGNVSSEDIFRSKFMSCFTYIMATCEGKEAAGRQILLHAIFLVLEYLPWTEARTFHNLVMVKLEQGRIRWSADFMELADQHIEKKVRESLRNKPQPASSTSGYRAGNRGFRSGRGSFRGQNSGTGNYNSGSEGRRGFVYCKQWNEGTCSYGVGCKRWHVCSVCGQAGKLGEAHKSSSSDCPNSRRGGQGAETR